MRRLRSMEKKLSKNDNLKREYCEQINNLLKMGAEPAPNQSTSKRLWQMSERCILTGPDLIRSLLGVLSSDSDRRVAVSADIKEMFLRVKIRENRDSLRFLWRNNMNENPQEYRMTSLIFGAASSPCTAIYIKIATPQNLNLAAFELRGWASNEIEVLNEMPDTRNDDNVQLGGDTRIEKTLGLQWDINNDALGFNLGLRNTPTEVLETSLPPTKRQVTSAVMSVFDPLGLASPVLITGKCMLQDIWRSGIDWDETIEADAHKVAKMGERHKEAGIDQNTSMHIARPHRGELHVFVDASEKSYAAAVYWRIKLSEHESAVSLIAGKLASLP
ncbi:hypothetical protein EVAR_91819_1 [Eumeta japonica]|uniref:Uncharacterized protein n=1 Tax=Eumeta variegata TaxID=151549 RepID=A0A4C1T855_EUMVA|nr:hypothetical protein EVAR_91819_1 [Eumeta japonica]